MFAMAQWLTEKRRDKKHLLVYQPGCPMLNEGLNKEL
jgi:hypothetical protein